MSHGKASEPLVLWAAPGACSRISLIALLRCGLPFRLQALALSQGAQRQAAFLALNPKGKVPLLQTPQGALSETVAICCWLDALRPEAGLLPPAAQPWERAQALSWLAFASAGLHPLIYRARMPQRIHPDPATHDQLRATALAELAQQLQVAEDRLAQGPWLCGARDGMADVALGWVWARALLSGLDATPFPQLGRFAERLAALPSSLAAVEAEAVLG